MRLVMGEIHGHIGEPGADDGHEDHDKGYIHYMLRLDPLSLANFEHNQECRSETKGYEETIGMNGQRAYGEEIRKHGESVELLSR
jgi:hypothetical protein